MTPAQREYLLSLDSSTLLMSPEVNALVAELWMEWVRVELVPEMFRRPATHAWQKPNGTYEPFAWHPSTNVAHAVEAMLAADGSRLTHATQNVHVGIWTGRRQWRTGIVWYSETDNDKGKAMALAIVRAIVAAMQAAEKAKESCAECACGAKVAEYRRRISTESS